MPGNNYNCSPSPTTPRSRLERLLREREIRKSNKYSPSTEEARDGNKEPELYSDFSKSENDLREEEILEKIAAARISDRFPRQDERPSKQRLLVVANRLPVSAIRKGVESWQLEISVGGLVSAILGMSILLSFIFCSISNPYMFSDMLIALLF